MFRTAESVSPMHPDKLCDQISDHILDAALSSDPDSRVAVETVGGHGKLFITGEMTTHSQLDIEQLAREIVPDITSVIVNIAHQSPEIARGVNIGGAGDQGIMIGYACDDTDQLMPLEVILARQLNQYLFENFPYDGKTQVTLDGDTIVEIVASFQHAKATELRELIKLWLEDKKYKSPEIFANPSGDWGQGGFDADAGLTGRKLVVDNYGPRIPIGGGCFSGKDGTKVDRSAAYMARKIAVEYLKKFEASEVFIRLAYAIGVVHPVETTAIVDGKLRSINDYDLSPGAIIDQLDLRKPQYKKTARYGHFGHAFRWDE